MTAALGGNKQMQKRELQKGIHLFMITKFIYYDIT